MVDEGFGLAGAFGDAEGVGEEFFDEEEVRGGGEGGVEGEDGAGAAEAVAGEVELGHGVYCAGGSAGYAEELKGCVGGLEGGMEG